MKKEDLKSAPVFEIHQERLHFKSMLAKNANFFGNIPGSKLEPQFQLIKDTFYEQLTCVGYNPETQNMEATFAIKRSNGYSGNLCASGSQEYVRFYLDFHDGMGFIDQGSIAVNVHNIPPEKDCSGKSIFPLSYVATLKKKTPKFSICAKPLLPTLRVILSWSQDPPANAPDWNPVWGNVMECDVQLKPWFIIKPEIIDIDLSKFLTLAIDSPNLTSNQISEIAGVDISKLKPAQESLQLTDLVKQAKRQKIPASRFAYKSIQKMIQEPISEMTILDKNIFSKADIDIESLIDELVFELPKDVSKANVDYEELECVGLDYNTESLVATLKIKKNVGYSGDLCKDGSKEYISFWIDWDDKCKWKYLDTVVLDVHDIKMEGDALCYSVTLPLDAKHYRRLCNNPNIVRVRSVLSWNIPPSTNDPNELKFYGNRVDAHIQIKPGVVIPEGTVIALFNIIGGIDVDHVNDASGLTKPGSFFAYNANPVPTGAPFGGKIVLNGPSFPGHRYKIKITNLADGTFTYANETFLCVGHLPHAPWVQYTYQSVDGAGFYHFLPHEKNTLNVLSRFTPKTNDQYNVEIIVDGVTTTFDKTILIDNTWPVIKLKVDDEGDCTHYQKGDTIKGNYYVNDKHLKKWSFGSTWGGAATGTVNTGPLPGTTFNIPTGMNAYPCGAVSLHAWDKTIIDSQKVSHEVHTSYNICLRDKEE